MHEYRIGFFLKQLVVANEKSINDELKEHQLTMSQVRILKYLFRNYQEKEIMQRDIEIYTDNKNPTVSGLLSRLESKELITREESKLDARAKIIIPTKKALALNDVIDKAFIDSNRRLISDFSEDECIQLQSYIERMLKNLEENGGKDND